MTATRDDEAVRYDLARQAKGERPDRTKRVIYEMVMGHRPTPDDLDRLFGRTGEPRSSDADNDERGDAAILRLAAQDPEFARIVALSEAAEKDPDSPAAEILRVLDDPKHPYNLPEHRDHLKAIERVAKLEMDFFATIDDDIDEIERIHANKDHPYHKGDPEAVAHVERLYGRRYPEEEGAWLT